MLLKTKPLQIVSYQTKQISKLKSILLLLTITSLGVLGRVAFQWIPSVEPIIPLTIALAFYHDWKKGAVCGTIGFFISNFFVWGFQGPWTIFQCLGAVAAALAGGLTSKISKRKSLFFTSLILGAISYEIIINLGSFIFFPWALLIGLPYLLAAIPFGFIHIVSTIGFGSIFYAFHDKLQDIWREEVLTVWYSDNSNPIISRNNEHTNNDREGGNNSLSDSRLWKQYN